MNNIEQICDALGRKSIADALGVSKAAVTNAISGGQFPASWFAVINLLCNTKQIECPTEMFNFKGAA